MKVRHVVFHSRGERMHQRTSGETNGPISCRPSSSPPRQGSDWAENSFALSAGAAAVAERRVRLLRLYSRACRLPNQT